MQETKVVTQTRKDTRRLPGSDGLIPVPGREDHFFLKAEVIRLLERVELLSERHPVNVLVVGPQGCGKSTLVRQFAARFNRPLAVFQVGILSEAGQLFGEHRLEEGRTYFNEFLFPKAVRTPRCVIHLEEINRPEHPKALNMLLSLLAEDRSVWIDEIGRVDVAPGVVFFATMNEGEEFVGTEMLDAALRDRFYIVALDYLPPEVETQVLRLKANLGEADALTVVNVANRLRTNRNDPVTVSTRHTLMIAEMVGLGASAKDAFVSGLQVGRDTLETVLLSVHLEGRLPGGEEKDEYHEY
ncbi:MAG TPA: MoxR family ATPase [Deltaproteobacteria bacterium]|nr:MoxR family ATPase [Deltaproteobacteria bacterium]HOM28478.1 MoxR family ATPase [Deltaproteobacteria bacterium]HPP80548.1 MoxR family ATPase [Deltaproteobacteria bacterium]